MQGLFVCHEPIHDDMPSKSKLKQTEWELLMYVPPPLFTGFSITYGSACCRMSA
jgi:hypothetical protein